MSGAVIVHRQELGGGLWMQVSWQGQAGSPQAGQFFLLRCGNDWSRYLRRSLFPANIDGPTLTFWGDPARDDAFAWLNGQPDGARLDLLGPFGRGFSVQHQQQRLLLVAQAHRVAALLALMGPQLGRGGHVGLLLEAPTAADLVPPSALPPAVEYYTATEDGTAGEADGLAAVLPRALQWADLLCAAGSLDFLHGLRRHVDEARYGLRSGFAQALAPVPLLCGVGACLACLVASGSDRGRHRACVRGPVFDLTELAA